MWRRVAIACALALIPISVMAFGLRSNPRAIPSPLVGRPAPAFSLPLMTDGSALSFANLQGRVVVLNFWASWCVPCRDEAPALEAVWRRYREAGVTVVGVNIQDRPAAARQFVVATRASYPNVLDGPGATSIAYGIYGVPETFLIDRDGRIRARHVGAITLETLGRHVAALVGGGS